MRLFRALFTVLLLLALPQPLLAVFDSAQFNAGSGPLELLAINPGGEEVPPARQLVLRFNRPVVPVGRMERDAAEIPVTINPPLACEWRWLDTSNLACQLGEKEAMHPATRYTVTVQPGIAAEDGATLAQPFVHSFSTIRPRIARYGYSFAAWRSPSLPILLVRFNQPVDRKSVADHLFFAIGGKRWPAVVSDKVEDLPDPREKRSVLTTGASSSKAGTAMWYLMPTEELPIDAHAELRIEPGVQATEGPLTGDEDQVVVQFDTFPEFRYLGISCYDNDNRSLFIPAGTEAGTDRRCSPHNGVTLQFSTPVAPGALRAGLKELPVESPEGAAAVAPAGTDTNVQAREEEELAFHFEGGDYAVGSPHRAGEKYDETFPFWIRPFRPYQATAAAADIVDVFGRPLPEDINLSFATDHYRPDYAFGHSVAVLEKGVESEVPIEIRNIERIDLTASALTTGGLQSGLKRSLQFKNEMDAGFRVPLDLRWLLDAPSGAMSWNFSTVPRTSYGNSPSFVQVTPFNLQVKIGHFNSLVWVTDFATGQPVAGARISLYRADWPGLVATPTPLASGVSDENGLVRLPGSEVVDPDLRSLNSWRDDILVVRCEKGEDLALMQLTGAYANGSGLDDYEDDYDYSPLQRKYGHIHAWGTTAQGVYRAGDTIQYKLYLRNQDNRRFVPPPEAKYHLKVIDPMGQTTFEVNELTLSEFGAYSGEFTVPASAPVGWYQFELSSDFGGEWEPMRVLVSDFTPAPFKVSSELNGELFRPGETITVATHARLHAGGPYADAGSRVTAQLTPTSLVTKNELAKQFVFDTWSGNVGTQTVYQGEENLDDAGDLQTRFSIDAPQVLYGQLRVESAVRDDRGKFVAGEAKASFVGRDRFVGLRQPDWILQVGKPARIEALVVDEHGEPVAGTPVHLKFRVRVTTASRVKGAGNAYLTRYEHSWITAGVPDLEPGKDADSVVITPNRPGLYEITATITDTQGREHTTKIERWGVGSGEVLWEGANSSTLKIIPKKEELKVGDTARYLVQNPFPGCKALVTVERYGILKSWVMTLKDSTEVIEVPIEPDYVPGFYLSVTAFSPRVDKPVENNVDLGKPAFRIGTVLSPVVDPYKELVVTAKADKEVYKPREKVTVDLQVAPRQKEVKLPPTELAVVVLDESVLDLIQGGRNYYDVYKGFYHLDGLDLRNYNLLMELVGRQNFEKKGASPGGDGGADLTMRSLFKFVSYWNPSVRTDADGKAQISFEVPDNLTGWRVLAMAVTPGDLMGLGAANFKVNRPTELRPVLPNQVLEGDRFAAGFTVMNRTDQARTLTVELTAGGAVDAPAKVKQQVVAPPYKRVELRLPVTTKGSGEVRLTARAYDASDGDLTQATVPVRKQIVTETAATYGTTTAESVEEHIAIPKEIRTDVGSVNVVLAPTVIGNLLGAFDYLRSYPYICWEQQLTKGVMASHYLQLKPWLPADFAWPEAKEITAKTLELAPAHQAPNGGMVYYIPQDEYVSPYLSAYTAIAFNWLCAAGYKIPQPVEEKLHAYLLRLLRRDELPSFYDRGMSATVRAVALAALAPHGKVTRADLERYRPYLVDMSLFGKAHYLQALLAVPGTEELRAEAAKLILAHANQTGGKFIFSETLSDGYARILASPLRDNAAVLSALLAYAETPDGARLVADVPFKLVRTITQGRGQRDRWENTQENMFCLNALIEYSRRYEKEKPGMTVTARLDGQEFGRTSFAAFTDPAQTLEKPLLPSDPGRKATVRLEKQGEGRLYYAARLTWAPLLQAAKPANAGIEVRREYSVERNGKWELLHSPMTIQTGELVRVDLFVSLPAARNFVVVDDPVPGGLEPVNRDLATTSSVDAAKGDVPFAGASFWYQHDDWREYGYSFWSFYHRELRHYAARFYSEYLSAGNYHLSYVAQAIAPGEFTVLPVKAEEMYDPDVFGRGVPAVLTVEKGK
jgi:alpha-2-macroglobulin